VSLLEDRDRRFLMGDAAIGDRNEILDAGDDA
jgi:hypothetical protein